MAATTGLSSARPSVTKQPIHTGVKGVEDDAVKGGQRRYQRVSALIHFATPQPGSRSQQGVVFPHDQ